MDSKTFDCHVSTQFLSTEIAWSVCKEKPGATKAKWNCVQPSRPLKSASEADNVPKEAHEDHFKLVLGGSVPENRARRQAKNMTPFIHIRQQGGLGEVQFKDDRRKTVKEVVSKSWLRLNPVQGIIQEDRSRRFQKAGRRFQHVGFLACLMMSIRKPI